MSKVLCIYFALFVCQISCAFIEQDCDKDVDDVEKCKAYIIVYKWDSSKGQCVRAIYGGCNPTPNNFVSMAQCEEIAAPICNGIAGPAFAKEDCTKGVSEGRQCRALMTVYTWNHQLGKCTKTTYGGCNATPNKFRTIEECEQIARPVCENVV